MIQSLLKLKEILGPKDKFKLIILLLMMLLAAVFEALSIGVIAGFVAVVAQPDVVLENELLKPVLYFLSISTARDVLLYGAVSLIIVFILKNSYIVFYKYTKSRFVYSRYRSISERLFSAYMRAPYTFHLKKNSAELIRNISSEASTVASSIMMPVLGITTEVVVAVSLLVMLFVIEPVITAATVVFLGGVSFIFLKSTRKKIQKHGKKAQEERRNTIKTLKEGLGGFKDITVLGRQEWFVKKFKKSINNLTKANIFKELTSQIVSPVMETVAITGMLVITVMLLFQGHTISSLASVLALFALSVRRLLPAVGIIVSQYNSLRYNIYAVDPIYDDFKLLSLKNDHDFSKNKEQISFNSNLEIKGVSYSYPECDEKIIKNISLKIKKGEVVGFVGTTGAGKTTLIDIMLGLLPPTKGQILIDGKDIYNNLSAWQRNIGYIPQFIYLTDDTIRNNIAIGVAKEDIDEDKINTAISAAQLTEFVSTLDKGVDTVIGEQGVRLSGGQRQRVGIARALYNDPEVLVMDEATSSLDNITEKFVIEALEKLKKDRTIIIIAHRLTTVRKCDRLYILEKGSITDNGSYDELKERNKKFKEMNES